MVVVLLSHTGAFLESTSRKRPTNFTFYPLGPLHFLSLILTLDELTVDGALQGGSTGLGFRLRTRKRTFPHQPRENIPLTNSSEQP